MYRSILLIVFTASSAAATARVCQPVDEPGNPAYGDTPTPYSEPLEVSEPDVGDTVEVPLPPLPPEPAEPPEIVPDSEPGGWTAI